MYFKAMLVVTGTNPASTVMAEMDAPDEVIAQIKKGLKRIPKILAVKANAKLVTVACNITFGTDVMKVLNGKTSTQNASRLGQFFGKMIIEIEKAHA